MKFHSFDSQKKKKKKYNSASFKKITFQKLCKKIQKRVNKGMCIVRV